MKENEYGVLHITPTDEGYYMVSYARPTIDTRGTATTLYTLDDLKQFLLGPLGIDKDVVAEAVDVVHPKDPGVKRKSHTIPNVYLSDGDAQRYGIR